MSSQEFLKPDKLSKALVEFSWEKKRSEFELTCTTLQRISGSGKTEVRKSLICKGESGAEGES